MGASTLVNRNVVARIGRTSMRLEPELWDALHDICQRENVSISNLVQQIELNGHPGGRTSAIRVHLVSYFRNAAQNRRLGKARTSENTSEALLF